MGDFREELRQEIAKGQVTLIVGAGVSIAATGNHPLASWNGLLKHGVEECVHVSQSLPSGWAERLIAEIHSQDIDDLLSAATKIEKKLGAPKSGDFAAWLKRTVGSLRAHTREVPEALASLGLPLLTTNYDDILEEVTGQPAVTWRDGAQVEHVLRGDERAIVHLHGYWRRPDTVVLGIRSYEEVLRDEHAQTMQRAMRVLRTPLFVGYGAGFEDPNFRALLEWSRKALESSPYNCYRLARESEVEAFQRQHVQGDRVRIVSYGKEFSDLGPFLRWLKPEARSSGGSAPAPSSQQAQPPAGPAAGVNSATPEHQRESTPEVLRKPGAAGSSSEVIAKAPELEQGVLPEFVGYGSALPPYMLNFRESLKENFVGRDREVWRLHEALQGSRTGGAPRAPATVLLHAAGGFGKTRLALEYMHRFGPRCYPGGQFWVDAAVSPEQLEEQFHGILRRFREDIPALDVCRRPEVREMLNIRKEVTEALEAATRKGPILFVVDNVPEPAQSGGPRPPLETWCPVIGRVSLIVTSRDLWVGAEEALAVSALSPEASETLLTRKLSESVRAQLDKGGALEVAKWVGHHPLALEILNKALRHGLTPARLLEAARHQRPVEAVRKYFEERVRDQKTDMKQGVFEAFELSYSKLIEPQQKLARLIAQLGAEPVPLVLAEKLEPQGLDGKALQILRDRHFVTPVDDAEGVGMYGEMHRLLADFLRELGERPRQELRESCVAVGEIVEQHDGDEPRAWPLLNACLPHAESVIERLTAPGTDTWTKRFISEGWVDTLRRPPRGEELPLGWALGRFLLASGRASHAERIVRHVIEHARSPAATDDMLELKTVLARALQAQGKYPAAEKLYGEVLDATRHDSEWHWRTLRVQGLMAQLVLERGSPREALKLAEEVLKAWEEMPHKDDSDNRDMLRARKRVAAIWHALGRADKAKDLQQQVLEQQRQLSQIPETENTSTLDVMSDLALSLYALRYLNEARTLQQQVLEARRRILGEKHPDTLATVDHLAETLRELQKYEDARALQEPALKSMKGVMGPEHPLTLRMEAHFAVTLRESGKGDEAREIQKRVLGLLERLLKPDHPMMLTVRSDLAWTLHQEKQWAEARQLQVRVVNDRRWVLKDDHPDTMEATGTLIRMLQEQGEWVEAAQQLNRAQKDVERVLGEDHPETIRSMSYLALSLAAQRKWKEARTLQERVLKERLRRWGEEHPDTLMAREDLARTFYKLGHYVAAAMHWEPVVGVRRRVLGPDHPSTLTAMANLALTLANQGDSQAARQLLEPVVKTMRRVLGPEHPDTLTAMGNLALALEAQGDSQAARQLLEPVVEVRRRVLGPEHPDTLTAMGNLASTLRVQGHSHAARQFDEQVVEAMRRVLGPEHPDTLTAMGNLAVTLHAQEEFQAARQLLEPVVEVRHRVLGPEHPDTLMAMGSLASTLKAQGDAKAARQLDEQVVEAMRRVLGPEHPVTLSAMGNLAVTLKVQGDLQAARQLQEQVVEVSRQVLGPEHPDTLMAMGNLAVMLKVQGDS